MPKVTNAFTTYQAKGNREDLADAIFNIDPVDTVFISMSQTRSLKNVMFDWQTEKLPTVDPNNNDVEGKAASLNVDMSISYKFNKNLEVTLEGVNLTNQPNDQFISRARNSSVVYNVTGREFLIGARYKF